jgi:hypothetical protein
VCHIIQFLDGLVVFFGGDGRPHELGPDYFIACPAELPYQKLPFGVRAAHHFPLFFAGDGAGSTGTASG